MTSSSADIDVVTEPGSQPREGRIASLDGIRAIAVLSVILFHYGQGWMRGGYVGVDVFFVLSGFLITNILVKSVPHRFSVRRFWERRARRLFPALALMLLAVFLYALVTPALEQAAIRGQGVATIFYVNNWWLLASGSAYFEDFAAPSPLLHTWTLSVEEQWYILLPLVLLVLVALRRFRWSAIFATLLVLLTVSVVWTFVLAAGGASVDRLYLGTDTRAQQLLLGGVLGCLAAWEAKRGRPVYHRLGRATNPLGVLGLAGLMAVFIFWPEGRWVPFQLPVAAVLSVMLIIGALDPDTAVSRWLSVRPLVAIGIISYGLYLWHWPIAVMVGSDETNAATPVRLILTFAIATASYLLIEKPVREGKVRLWWFVPVAIGLLVMAFVCTPKATQATVTAGPKDHAAPPYSGSGVKTFFVGDSISGTLWAPAAARPRDGIAVTGSYLLGCPVFGLLTAPVDGKAVPMTPGGDCNAWEQQWRSDMAAASPDVGVYVGTSSLQFDLFDEQGVPQPFGSQGYYDRLTRALDGAFAGFTAKQIAITSVPCTALPSNVINDQKNDRARTEALNQFLRNYAERNGYAFIDLGAVACAPDTSGLYYDGLHLSPEGALQVWEELRPALQQL